MTDRRDLYDMMEHIFPPDVSTPAEKLRQVIARTAFLMSLLEHREKEAMALFEQWAGSLRRSPAGTAEWPDEATGGHLWDDAARFLAGLGLAWPWLVSGLGKWFLLVVARVEPQPYPLPPEKRIMRDLARAIERKEHPGRFPKAGGQHVAEWARWFYRTHFCGESVRQIAKERHDREHPRQSFDQCDCRKAVNYGLGQAAPLLNPA